ncbi:MAG: hypothetical protein ACE5JM_03140, partial [Armatimonadota bacterium]
ECAQSFVGLGVKTTPEAQEKIAKGFAGELEPEPVAQAPQKPAPKPRPKPAAKPPAGGAKQPPAGGKPASTGK